MLEFLMLTGFIIITCILFNKFSNRIGVPMLLTFIILGMVFGEDGIFKINFNNYFAAEVICSIALVFIIFYGGFGTRWEEAKSVSVKAILTATLGVVLTAAITGMFCFFVLKIDLIESFLIGSVLSSTDAASVFSILKGKKLSLKYKTDSMIELESGSNDPFAYMLTTIFLTISSGIDFENIFLMLFKQILIALVLGYIIAKLSMWFLKKISNEDNGFDSIFVTAVAILSYAIPSYLGGNGYLSTYIVGIILGNSKIINKKGLVNFFDGITALMQILIFFLLGLLVSPTELANRPLTSMLIALFITFVARPVSVFAILKPFKSPKNQIILFAFAGLRGAASIVFSILVITSGHKTNMDIFHITFFIVLFSIFIQGGFLPHVAKKLDMIDSEKNISKTFSDYVDEVPVQFIELEVDSKHNWKDKLIRDINIPQDLLLALISRNDERIIPNGNTKILEGDIIILSAKAVNQSKHENKLYEIFVDKNHKWSNKLIQDIGLSKALIVLVKRDSQAIVPRGNTLILPDDVLVINEV